MKRSGRNQGFAVQTSRLLSKRVGRLLRNIGIALVLVSACASSRGATTVVVDHGASWAGGVSGNQSTVDFFNNSFSNVTVLAGDYSDTSDAGVRAVLASADVLVLCRTTYSGGYDTTDETYYNSSLTIPVICLTSYLSRDTKLGWESGDVASSVVDGNETTVTAAGASVFGVSGTVDWWSGTGEFNAAGSGAAGEGEILALIGGYNLAVGWMAGARSAAGNTFSGNRLLFNIPGSGNTLPDTDEGVQAMIDAVAAYTSLIPRNGSGSSGTGGGATNTLTVVEAESGILGTEFGINTLGGATNITISVTGGGYSPGSDARVATYTITFPGADTYQLYARLYVGVDGYNDDSFFYATSFGSKSATTDADWSMANGLASTGFTVEQEAVTSGGASGTQIWKWVKWDTLFTVNEGSLTQTFQVGGREDGLYLDKFVFGPSDEVLTVENLDSGFLPEPTFSTNTFDGPFGMAVHRFDEVYENINRDGEHPVGLAPFGNGLCGMTFSGGEQGDGTVFTMSLDGSEFSMAAPLSSALSAGHPQGTPIVSGSTFFGTAAAGGANSAGAVLAAQENGRVTLLQSFDALSNDASRNTGGAYPCALMAQSGATLYGAASAGGAHGEGTLFSVSTNGTGFTVLHTFSALDAVHGTNADGAVPYGGPVRSGDILYGTASGGGEHGAGVVYSIASDGSDFTVLYHFQSVDPWMATNSGGAFPCSGLVCSNNVLYGTTLSGGTGGCGTLFAVGIDGSGFTVLHDFAATDPLADTNAGGAAPCAELLLCGNVLYGTASAGGSGAAGSVFSLDITDPVMKTIYEFEPVSGAGTNNYGAYPTAPVVRVGNSLYGSAFGGGPGGAGTIFRLSIPAYASVSGISDGSLMIDFVGAPNSSCVVQATEDLSSLPVVWQDLSTNLTDSSGRWTFYDAAVLSNRFYRAQSL
ncbi:MAG: hypothetical protein JXR25_08355 [Pontiellaceae bacterium]|nr:hypothetical protein [Pontiellaceae bacterium]MBN2784825.1 hypothetical protein [Pontiellaceae bacterium]